MNKESDNWNQLHAIPDDEKDTSVEQEGDDLMARRNIPDNNANQFCYQDGDERTSSPEFLDNDENMSEKQEGAERILRKYEIIYSEFLLFEESEYILVFKKKTCKV